MRTIVRFALACVACSCGVEAEPRPAAAVQHASSDEADLQRSSLFGMAIATIGDVDGDAVPDFAVGEPGRDRVWIYSGAERSVVRTIESDERDIGFGWTLAAPGDLNDDDVPDLLVGASGSSGGFGPLDDEAAFGSVRAVDGATGTTLYATSVPADEMKYAWYNVAPGPALAVVGDIDGDGVADFVVGSALAGDDHRGRVSLCSGSNGSVLRSWEGERADEGLGTSVLAAGDLDGDRRPDVVVATRPSHERGAWSGAVRAWSCTTGESIARYAPPQPTGGFGWSLALVRGPGHDVRLLVGDAFHDDASVHVFDARTGALLDSRTGALLDSWSQEGRGPVDGHAGAVLATLPDLDADGVQDVAVVAPHSMTERLWIVGGSDGGELMTLVVPPDSDTRFNAYVGLRMDLLGPIDGETLLLTSSASVRSPYGRIVTAFRLSDGAIAFEIFAP